jgi:hypothetical protein
MWTLSWAIYAGINPKVCRCSMGLRRPREILMRFSLYQQNVFVDPANEFVKRNILPVVRIDEF